MASPPTTVALTALAQLGGPKANETEMGAALFTKNGEGRTLTWTWLDGKGETGEMRTNMTRKITLIKFVKIHIRTIAGTR